MSDREWAYVAASRHRRELRVFADRDQMDMLEPMLNRSRQKDVTLDYDHVDQEADLEVNR
jgi:ATP-dependent exoDNAse (exonuclease V) alpha subunit